MINIHCDQNTQISIWRIEYCGMNLVCFPNIHRNGWSRCGPCIAFRKDFKYDSQSKNDEAKEIVAKVMDSCRDHLRMEEFLLGDPKTIPIFVNGFQFTIRSPLDPKNHVIVYPGIEEFQYYKVKESYLQKRPRPMVSRRDASMDEVTSTIFGSISYLIR